MVSRWVAQPYHTPQKVRTLPADHPLTFGARQPMLVASNGRRPDMKLKSSDYHLFLSHVWSTGQDACATIKTQLQLLLPNVKIFLDVTDVSLAPLVSVAFMTGTRASE